MLPPMIRTALILAPAAFLGAIALAAAPAWPQQDAPSQPDDNRQDEDRARDPLSDLLDDIDRRRTSRERAGDQEETLEDDSFEDDDFEDEPFENPFGFEPEATPDPSQEVDPAIDLIEPGELEDEEDAAPPAVGDRDELSSEPGSVALLRGLDKVTARTRDFEAPVGEAVMFGALEITVRYCRRRPPEEVPEIFAFVQIDDGRAEVAEGYRQTGLTADPDAAETGEEPSAWLYSGWMFGSNPALNPLDHPVYDVWVIDCRA